LRIGGITLLVLLGVFFLREQLSGAKIIGLGLSFMGLYLLFSK
jgi:multidrug transporter EmrE-like cation transporter